MGQDVLGLVETGRDRLGQVRTVWDRSGQIGTDQDRGFREQPEVLQCNTLQ